MSRSSWASRATQMSVSEKVTSDPAALPAPNHGTACPAAPTRQTARAVATVDRAACGPHGLLGMSHVMTAVDMTICAAVSRSVTR